MLISTCDLLIKDSWKVLLRLFKKKKKNKLEDYFNKFIIIVVSFPTLSIQKGSGERREREIKYI